MGKKLFFIITFALVEMKNLATIRQYKRAVALVFMLLLGYTCGVKALHTHTSVALLQKQNLKNIGVGKIVSGSTTCEICDFTLSPVESVATNPTISYDAPFEQLVLPLFIFHSYTHRTHSTTRAPPALL